jgi:hypothetical protein
MKGDPGMSRRANHKLMKGLGVHGLNRDRDRDRPGTKGHQTLMGPSSEGLLSGFNPNSPAQEILESPRAEMVRPLEQITDPGFR